MAKLLDAAIVESDISDYLAAQSDFGFELQVLKLLRSRSISCEHGGHYTDPVTKKSREFDIRARVSIENVTARLAIECKNIRANYPIVVSRLPRSKEDSFNEMCEVDDPPAGERWMPGSILRSRTKCIKNQDKSIYRIGEPVGKSLAQVGRTSDNSITSGDSEVYEKWGQALASLTDLVQEMSSDGINNPGPFYSVCIPAIVVPNNRLWAADYNDDGDLIGKPQAIEHCSFFIGKNYQIGLNEPSYVVSHLEIFTLAGFTTFIDDKLRSVHGLRQLLAKP